MDEKIEDWARANVKCCACGGRLDTGEVLNVCVTKKVATWIFPVCGSLERPDYPPKAVAMLCDECVKNKVKIRYVVEWEGTPYQVKYHDIDSLEDEDVVMSKIKYYFGQEIRFKRLVRKAARQESEN